LLEEVPNAKPSCVSPVYLGGSANFTSNEVKRNEERLLTIKLEEVVTTYLEWFEHCGSQARTS
jgi:hypothetical protein